MVSRKGDSHPVLVREVAPAAYIEAAVFREEHMHVHANYSLQLASLGASREEVQEVAARRSAEVRRKLFAAAGALGKAGDAVSAPGPRTEEQPQEPEERDEDEFGRLLSVRA